MQNTWCFVRTIRVSLRKCYLLFNSEDVLCGRASKPFCLQQLMHMMHIIKPARCTLGFHYSVGTATLAIRSRPASQHGLRHNFGLGNNFVAEGFDSRPSSRKLTCSSIPGFRYASCGRRYSCTYAAKLGINVSPNEADAEPVESMPITQTQRSDMLRHPL